MSDVENKQNQSFLCNINIKFFSSRMVLVN